MATDLDPEGLDRLASKLCLGGPGLKPCDNHRALAHTLLTAYGVPDLHSRLRELEEENERLRGCIHPDPFSDDPDLPVDLNEEKLRCRTAAELIECGHLVEAAGVLYGCQSRITRAALSGPPEEGAAPVSTAGMPFGHIGEDDALGRKMVDAWNAAVAAKEPECSICGYSAKVDHHLYQSAKGYHPFAPKEEEG